MREERWLAATDPAPLLTFVLRWASDRRLRLFCAACCRRVWPLLTDERSRAAVAVAERFAAGLASADERAVAEEAGRRAYFEAGGRQQRAAAEAAAWTVAAQAPARKVAGGTLPFYHYPDYRLGGGQRLEKETQQAHYLRDIFGNPFRATPGIAPSWLAWNGGTVFALAHGIHDDRAFDRLPILGDALEDAGCADANLLSHLRGPGPHVRGCWLLDLILGQG